jgi:penicillin-binding protein 1A
VIRRRSEQHLKALAIDAVNVLQGLAARRNRRAARCRSVARRALNFGKPALSIISHPCIRNRMTANGRASAQPDTGAASSARPVHWSRGILRVIGWVLALTAAGAVSLLVLVGIAVAVAYPNVPEIDGLADYRPKLPMRIYAADGVLLGEFGEERRNFTPIGQIPKVMKDAVLAAEDSRFYEHGGIDYKGVLRAALANLRDARSQGGSTITM